MAINRMELRKILKEVLTCPTAPFYEAAVARVVRRHAEEAGLPVAADAAGNLIVVAKPKGRPRKGRIGFVAHMDHPGFEIIESKGKTATAQWWGGVWKPFFRQAKVLVHHEGGVRGRVTRTFSPKDAPKRVETMRLKLDAPVPVGAFGQWDLDAFRMDGSLIVTRAADDLVSVVAQLALMRELSRTKVRHEVWLIFTRAEEQGFCGALSMLKDEVLPKDLALVSLETSKHLPGTAQGDGPVIRLGDRMAVFSSDLCRYMEVCAEACKKSDKRFKFQRRVMDGGACEATAFITHGFTTGGIAFPLGNYHNMGDEPGPDGKAQLKEETVHVKDLQNGVTLMTEMCRQLDKLPQELNGVAKRLQKRNKPYDRRLKETPQ